MKWFSNLSTRAKLFVSFGVMFGFQVILIAMAFTTMAALQRAQQETQRSQKTLVEKHFANVEDNLIFRRNQHAARADLLLMMSSPNRAQKDVQLNNIKKAIEENDTIIQNLLKRNQDDSATLSKIKEMVALRDIFNQTRDRQVIPLIYGGKIAQAQQISLGIQQQRFDKMRELGVALGKDATDKAQAAVAESEQQTAQAAQRAKQTVQIFLMVGGFSLLVGVLMAGFLGRIIANPLAEITGAAEKIALGDLSVTITTLQRHDEVGVLSQTFHRMLGGLRDVNLALAEAVNVLSSSASEISASTSQLAASATETASAVTETTATVEEIRQTAQVASEKARFVSENAQTAARISQGGKKATLETSEGMARIREQMDSIGQSMMRLSEQSAAIGEIIAVVDDLAQQSNLLAVNAAIEAAKAGEGGKGFAVVAQEVKSLADQSKQATTHVRSILSDIQKATGAAVMVTEQGSKAVEIGVFKSEQAGESIQTLAENVDAAAQSAMQIAASSQQQLVGMDQMTLAMESIKQASMQNVDGARQLEEAARNVSDLGQKLKQLVEQYKM